LSPDRIAASYRPDGSWACTRDRVTSPCGECDGCRHVQAGNLGAAPGQPGGLRLSDDSRGGFAVPRELAGHPIRRTR
jgi:hypothetical protein